MISQEALRTLETHQAKYPGLATTIESATLQYKEKMWHEISTTLIAYAKDKAFDTDGNTDLLELYENMIKGLSTKLNPIRYALITILVSRQHNDIEQSIAFLDEASTRLEGRRDAQYLCRIAQAEKKLSLGLHHDCLQILNEVKEQIESASDIDPKVIASLAENFAAYYRRKEDQENFYKASLQFLAYTPATDMTEEEKKQWSIKMGMAVLLGKNIYNISELVSCK